MLETAKEQGGTVAYVVTKLSDGEGCAKELLDDGTGVQEQIASRATSLANGKVDSRQAPEQVLQDIESPSLVISLLSCPQLLSFHAEPK